MIISIDGARELHCFPTASKDSVSLVLKLDSARNPGQPGTVVTAVIPMSPMLRTALELEADQFRWVQTLQRLLYPWPKKDKK